MWTSEDSWAAIPELNVMENQLTLPGAFYFRISRNLKELILKLAKSSLKSDSCIRTYPEKKTWFLNPMWN